MYWFSTLFFTKDAYILYLATTYKLNPKGNPLINKSYVYAIIMSLILSFHQACAEQSQQTLRRKSKEVALIKAIGGIALICASPIVMLQGIFIGVIGYRDHSKSMVAIGSVEIPIAVYLGSKGYKLAKEGIRDLEELAQKEGNLVQQ